MNTAKPCLLALLMTVMAGTAMADDAARPTATWAARLDPQQQHQQQQHQQRDGAEQEAPRNVMPRRAVPATVARMPAPPAPAANPAAPVIPAQRPVGPPAPAPVTGCDAGGCWSGGVRYQGSGGTYTDRAGKVCQNNGGFMQCF
ncbi:hypothetical protein [Noviherbaspirillum aerium]|uniref:hypothetical protein n=1 Tax=Noviherbaspirillum aerium TaxID=2588497 RepID=UPI00124F5C79|nr:hypothetical protein [Noviherbaspirillum aerium]